MNPLGIHYGCFVENWGEDQFVLVRKARDLGYDLLETGVDYLLSLDDRGLENLKKEAADCGVGLVASMGMTASYDISSPESAVRKRGITLLKDIARMMSRAGISDCSGITYGAWNGKLSEYGDKPSRLELSAASMREAVKAFEDAGVYINVEVANRFETFLINCCDEALAYADAVGSPHVGIHLDTFHMNIEEDSFSGAILKAGGRLRYFHAGENNRKMPGMGMLPWKSIFDTLRFSGYRGPVTLEPFVRPVGSVGKDVSLYREILPLDTYEADLVRSREFLQSLYK